MPKHTGREPQQWAGMPASGSVAAADRAANLFILRDIAGTIVDLIQRHGPQP